MDPTPITNLKGSSMQALVFNQKKGSYDTTIGFEKEGVPNPVLVDDREVLIRLHYAGVCGSDKGIWFRRAFKDQIERSLRHEKKSVRIIGHEFFGEVADLSKAATAAFKLKWGDTVSSESHIICNKCPQCLIGEKHVCTNEKILGISYDGAFAEYIKVPGHVLWKTDTKKIRPEVAAVQEPFGNAVHAASKVPLEGNTIAIFGLGPVGLFLTLVARGMGARRIIGIEPNETARAMGERLGVDYTIPLGEVVHSPHHDSAITEEILNITKGLGVDVAFEMSGSNQAFNNTLFSVRRGGAVIGFGITQGDFVLEDYNRFIVRGITLHAVIGRQIFQTWETTRKLLSDEKNHIAKDIFDVILAGGRGTILPFADFTKASFEKAMLEHPKILLKF